MAFILRGVIERGGVVGEVGDYCEVWDSEFFRPCVVSSDGCGEDEVDGW